MPLNILTINSVKNELKFTEDGVTIRVSNPSNEERIVFYEIDNQTNSQSPLRREWRHEGPLCDLLIFYKNKNNTRKFLCLGECKKTEIEKGKEQIINTYNTLKEKFYDAQFQPLKWGAYISCPSLGHGSSPRHKPKVIKIELKKELDSDACEISKNEDISDFLRQHGV